MKAKFRFRVEVTEEDGWWMIRVPLFDLTTQAETWDEVEEMAVDVIACHMEMDPAAVDVEVFYNGPLAR